MRLKSGVRLLGLKPETWAIVLASDPIWLEAGVVGGVMITSAVDGTHKRASKHYAGLALDLRTYDLPAGSIETTAKLLGIALGQDFDVILEPDHIHAEYDPKEPL